MKDTKHKHGDDQCESIERIEPGSIPAVHELKTWPEQFDAVVDGSKLFELRKDDRPYKVGDILFLRKFDPVENKYLNTCFLVFVTYIDRAFTQSGWATMGIRHATFDEAEKVILEHPQFLSW